jgi:predicted metal-dependent hydrolase
MAKHYWTYYKPGYHPWQEADQVGYAEWLAAFNGSKDPLQASEQMRKDLALSV